MDRFWTKVQKAAAAECWLWTAQKSRFGYGYIKVAGRPRIATHVALELDGRPRPAGLIALHSCDNPSCVNPAHLRWGTRKENTADMDSRGRRATTFYKAPKLDRVATERIRASSETLAALAAKFGVSSGTVFKVRHGIHPYRNES